MPIDYTTPVGQVRLLIADDNAASPVFTNEAIAAFLTMEGNVVKRAAALAYETIAADEALTSKVIRTQDLATDGAKVAAALQAQAKEWRAQAAVDLEDTDGGFYDIVPLNPAWPWPAGEPYEIIPSP